MNSTMNDFSLLQSFVVWPLSGKAPVVKQVDWHHPFPGCVKCNTDGAAKGSPGFSGCGGLFRDYIGSILGCFSHHVGISYSLNADLMAAMIAIETAYQKGCHTLWLEYDSLLVVQAFSKFNIVPWPLRNQWRNCLHIYKLLNFAVTHIYRREMLVPIN